MSLGSSFILYLMCGVGVAVAVFVREEARDAAGVLRIVAACVFWPLYVPVLLARAPAAQAERERSPGQSGEAADDDMAAAITRVEGELDRALQTLDGWTEGALSLETARFDELIHAWHAQADRIRELSKLLESAGAEALPAGDAESPGTERLRHSEQARRENIERLEELRRRMHDDLLGTLAWVRELVTMIHLAKYTGAPASRAEELVAQIAAAVEGLSEVSDWRREPAECSPVIS
jgi:hypothetical protein